MLWKTITALVAGLVLTASYGYAAIATDKCAAIEGVESGGNPGGLPVFQCLELVEGDVIPIFDVQEHGDDLLSFVGSVTVSEIGEGFVTLTVSLTNNSNGELRITSFGLGIDPDALAGTLGDPSGTDTDAFQDVNIVGNPGSGSFPGFQLVEFCAVVNNCAGGGGGGLEVGQTDVFTFNLTNGFEEGGTIDLSQFAVKFQDGADGASYEKPGIPDVPETPQIPQTPETPVANPATMTMLGVSLLGIATASGLRNVLRRRRK